MNKNENNINHVDFIRTLLIFMHYTPAPKILTFSEHVIQNHIIDVILKDKSYCYIDNIHFNKEWIENEHEDEYSISGHKYSARRGSYIYTFIKEELQ